VFDGAAPVLAGKRISGVGDAGGGGESEVFGEEAEVGGVVGSATDGDDDGEPRGEVEDGEGEETNHNVPQGAVFRCGWFHGLLRCNHGRRRKSS